MNPTTEATPWMPLRIAHATNVAEGIRSFELVHAEGIELPAFTPGSHVRLTVPNGEVRKYSLCNDPAERHRYVVAVKRDATGRGGSMSLVDEAREGDVLQVGPPENAFEMTQRARRYVFIAGGIGITPILSMIHSLRERTEVPWTLYYLTRSEAATAFIDELVQVDAPGKVRIHHDHGDPANALDLWAVLEKPADAHIYCCGPRALMESVRDMTGHWIPGRVHFESFNEGGGVGPDDRPFTVELARSGLRLKVPVGRSILQVVREAGCSLPASCESGTCGTCRTRLLAGEADHRDMVLMPEEKDTQIMPCVSRARSAELVLDL